MRRHPHRPQPVHHIPAAAVPGGHRRPVRAGYRGTAAPYPWPPAQCGSPPRRSGGHRQAGPADPHGRWQHAGLRQPAAGHRRHPRLLRQRPMGR
ncbi:hypothetical protein G6F46_015296 [Rhizopus delemar]|nr:hypothetical protein G6F46_015296 [Rhizopus delemar]